jgi:hypothetical protein
MAITPLLFTNMPISGDGGIGFCLPIGFDSYDYSKEEKESLPASNCCTIFSYLYIKLNQGYDTGSL